jgi:O-antigen ligase
MSNMPLNAMSTLIMDGLFLKQGSTATKISYYHLLLFMASLPFNMFYSHIILISFSIHALIQLNKKDIKPVFTWRNLALQSVFFITVLSTIYSINQPEAFNEWGKHIAVLLFPILFCFTSFDIKKYRSQLLLGFSLICTATILYLYFDALRTIRFYGLPYKSITTSAFTNHNFAEPIDIHATFLSLQIVIALIYLLSVLLKERSKKMQLLYAGCVGILLVGLMQLSAKSVIIPLFFILNLVVPLFLLEGKRRFKFMTVTASLSVLLIAGVLTFGFLKNRYVANLKYDLTLTANNQKFDSRLDRWSTAVGLIKKSPVMGYGAGSELGLLHESFFAKQYYNSFLNHLNSHNEYLSILLKSGIFGLLIYLATLWFGFKQALKNKDVLFFTFMLLIAFVSFSENLLDVDKGVIFYAFFFSFFIFSGDEKTYEVLKTS